jgi:tyrosyl-tRNA synthetase
VEVIDRNSAALKAQLSHFLDFEGPAAARVMNNADWLRGLGLMEFLRDTGKHFTVNYMLQKESVQSRMETGISFTEFSYMLVQAYDFWHLFRTGVRKLVGGSDQWGTSQRGSGSSGGGRAAHGWSCPPHDGGRFEVREERRRQRLARPGAHQPVQVLPVLAQHR